MDQPQPDDLVAVREERRLLREQMQAPQDHMDLLEKQRAELKRRREAEPAGLDAAAGLTLLEEYRQVTQRVVAALQEHLHLLHQYRDVHTRYLALSEESADTD